ncbi:protein-disulfide reductase DsbD family protein [Bdellovibrio bacteriovorus]|uniref:protein-disulfide reductase DsbD family protein n=1 Tax=Bdellovibrio bacteriovorus TaxID=959 RepID=UPI0035A7239C
MLLLARLLTALITTFSCTSFAADTFHFAQGEVKLISSQASWNENLKPSLGIHFKIKDHWHIYWKNSGDSGAPPKWNWNLTNAKLTKEHWPLPERIPVEGLINFGYSNESLFVFDLEPEAKQNSVQASVHIEFLICKIECVPYFTELKTEIPYSAQRGPPAEVFSKFVYPAPAPSSFSWVPQKLEGSTLKTVLNLSSQATPKNLEIFPEDGESFKASAPELTPDGNNFEINLALQDTSKTDFEGARFLLVTENAEGKKQGYEISLQKTAPASLGFVVLWALLGGFILNFMPCVFPVLSIKVLSFLGPDKNAQSLRTSGLFYTLGVMVSFLILGGALMLLRAGGEQIGWGFQLQSPVVAAGISILFFWLGLNFLGTFEIGQSLTYLGAKKTSSDRAGSFLTGVLATVVATPCTAPFMGAALGASLAMPAASTLLVFAGLGLGMAFPFLILAYFPKTIQYLPKPGAWMEKLKEFLAFPLFATVLWLLWVLSHQVTIASLLFLLGIYLIIALWIWTSRQVRNERWKQILLLLGFLFSFAVLVLMPQESVTSMKASQSEAWKTFSQESIAEDIAQGKAVFIDFTAAWCITCQVNKKLVLHTSEIQSAFTANAVQLYQADWTDKNPAITEALAGYGRNSLPLYVYYAAGSNKPQILPEILTKGIILELFYKEKE